MSISITNTSRIAAVAIGVGLVLAVALGGFAAPAHARLSSAEIQSILSLLQSFGVDAATIANVNAALTGAPATPSAPSMSCTFTRALMIGATGADVTCLQQALIAMGYSIPAGATGYFGSQTQAAVSAWQAANGISPAAGYFGPISQGKWAMVAPPPAMPPAPAPTPTGPLSGVGRIANLSGAGDIESDLKEGDPRTSVIGLTGDVRGGDVAIQRVDVEFRLTQSNGTTPNGGSSSLNRYVRDVSIYLNGQRLATMDAADGDRDGRVWTFRFANLNGVVRNGEQVNLYVQVTPVSSIGINENGENVFVRMAANNAIRAVSADGISETYGPGSNVDQNFSVSTATAGEVTVSEASNNPLATTVRVDEDVTTEDVLLLSVDLRARRQNVTVNDFPVQLCTTGSGSVEISNIVQTVKLMRGSTQVKSKTISSGEGLCADVVFDGINRSISRDDTQNFRVLATFKKKDGNYNNGTTTVASTTPQLAWDIDDAEGNSVTPTGSPVGGVMTLQTTGMTVELVSTNTQKTTATVSGSADFTQYTIVFRVTAGKDDLWIGKTASRSGTGSATADVKFATTSSSNSDVTLTTDTGNLSASGTNTGDSATGFKVNAGSSRTFTLNVTLTASSTAGGYSGIRLAGVGYDTDSTVNNTVGTSPYSTGLDDFKTADVFMRKL